VQHGILHFFHSIEFRFLMSSTEDFFFVQGKGKVNHGSHWSRFQDPVFRIFWKQTLEVVSSVLILHLAFFCSAFALLLALLLALRRSASLCVALRLLNFGIFFFFEFDFFFKVLGKFLEISWRFLGKFFANFS
jgi:hypothetical protein